MYNQHQGFGAAVQFVVITIVLMAVIGCNRYYILDRKRRLSLILDIYSDRVQELIVILSVMLWLILMIMSWQPLVELFDALSRWAANVFAFVATVFLSAIYYCVLRIVVCITSREHKSMLQRRRAAIYRSRQKRIAIKIRQELEKF
ncbi:hypothetical protein IJG22_03610 [Candidatus Saccharibacteria bacterium]|nr:hypothetical protein [Candidatus Saccharibacteria bacterium]